MKLTSAGGVISLLDEPDTKLKIFALEKLNLLVDDFWAEIADSVEKIEMFYEDIGFPQKELAALVASKVYYHLGAFEESLTYALGAGKLFDVNSSSEYVDTTISKCIDHYTKLRVHNMEHPDDPKEIDSRLEDVVDRMFQRCYDDQEYKQVVGIALETRRIDSFEKAIMQADDVSGMLSYSLKVTLALLQQRQFRNEVLRLLVRLYMNLAVPDYISVCQCLIFLDDAQAVADILSKLIKESHDQTLMAYQIGFDLYASATQQFLARVQASLRASSPVADTPSSMTEAETKDGDAMETDVSKPDINDTADEGTPVDGPPPAAKEEDRIYTDRLNKLMEILSGSITIGIHLQFLIRSNKTDVQILKNTKDVVRNSVCHNATVIANSFMHCGTTCDSFLRDNLDWLSRATNWAKFTATASLGVIHRGHEKEALNLMSTYLPKDTGPGSAYQEGGGLYALGLIHANHGANITEYLLGQLKEATTDMVRHGGCLGLGLAAMGTARQDVYEQLKFNLYEDDAVTGEAAGLAMGLVMIGSKSASAIEDMVSYAQDTQHEKILRGLCLGIALTMYGRLEEADPLIESLCRDKDPILRRSGMYTIALAYCGTGNNQAIRRLLHFAVSDVDDDVRRAAVTSLGFIMFRTPEQVSSIVSLLSESYNPHVRYGAAMALGISCAGTGNKEALGLLEPMISDSVNYVRQGALIASALVLIQHNENTCPKVTTFRNLYSKTISDKHEDVMAKFGAILAQGIIDAGGRNMTISMQSSSGHTHMSSVVGILVFIHFWYWFPLAHFLSLSFTPATVVGLNADLKMPVLEIRSNAKPSMYAYTPPLETPKEKEKEKVATAVLSITAKAKKRERKEAESKMEVDEPIKEEEKDADKEKKDKDSKKEKEEETTTKEGEGVEEKKEKKVEPSFEILSSPARIMIPQLKVLCTMEGSRYLPVKQLSDGGIIMMKDTAKDEPEEIVLNVPAGGPKMEEEEEEPEPPEPFEYVED
ncbi:26S proteasome non-ATPase regulatory subunit 1-like [Acanthaster planci]|uniref:26S proteasome non-ATPase regulatory subunit 1 n=1 Tax=Acanthaster planci TaxID=133434 RepID=A0A8B7YKH9_ACAPL|nr:26S proteasome non-ATPase regulatory subunit 1-like [Acanthaster planci]